MEYRKAYIKLYGAAGAAIDELYKSFVVTKELDNAIEILKSAVAEVEDMDEDGHDEMKDSPET